MQIDHIAIWTYDLEMEKDFYLKYFDCSVNEKYLNSGKQFASYFITFSGGPRIELMRRPDIRYRKKSDSLGLAHLAINVGTREKVDNLTESLEKDGIVVGSRPRITGDGYYESVILDPENNVIEILSLL
jgi:lactoylglutathione lyase